MGFGEYFYAVRVAALCAKEGAKVTVSDAELEKGIKEDEAAATARYCDHE